MGITLYAQKSLVMVGIVGRSTGDAHNGPWNAIVGLTFLSKVSPKVDMGRTEAATETRGTNERSEVRVMRASMVNVMIDRIVGDFLRVRVLFVCSSRRKIGDGFVRLEVC